MLLFDIIVLAFQKHLTQRRGDAELLFVFFASLRLCVRSSLFAFIGCQVPV
jgi:hypothetical protein